MTTRDASGADGAAMDTAVARAGSVRHRVDRVCRLAEQARNTHGDANIAAHLIQFAELNINETEQLLDQCRDEMDDVQRALAESVLVDISTGRARIQSARESTGTRPTGTDPYGPMSLFGETAALTGEIGHHRNQTANHGSHRMRMAHARAAAECHEMLADTVSRLAAMAGTRTEREVSVLSEMGGAIRTASMDYEDAMAMRRQIAPLDISPGLAAVSESDLIGLAQQFREADDPVAVVPATEPVNGRTRVALLIIYDDGEWIRVKQAGEPYPDGTPPETAEEHARHMLDVGTTMTEQPRDERDVVAGQLMLQECARTHNLAAHGMHCADTTLVALALETAERDVAIGRSGRRAIGAALAGDPDTTRQILGPDPARVVSDEQAKAILKAAEDNGVQMTTIIEIAELLGVSAISMGYAQPMLLQAPVETLSRDLLQAGVLPAAVARALLNIGATEQQIQSALRETLGTVRRQPENPREAVGTPKVARIDDVVAELAGEPGPPRTTPGGLILA